MITGEENLMQIAELGSELITVFEKHGLGSYFKSENLNKIGKFMRLESLLKAKNIERERFIGMLNQIIEDKGIESSSDLMSIQSNLHFSAMLPCGLRNPFKEFFEGLILDNPEDYNSLNYLVEGNVNHELSYYPLLDSISDENELPDIILASDVNNFFHRPFIEKFVEKGVFQTYTPFTPNNYLEKAGFADPSGNFTMLTANMLIIVVDEDKLGDRKMPSKWSDLLDPSFKNEIIMRGEDNFFCNAVMLPFYKENGFDGIRIMAENIRAGMHPAEMVKLAGSNREEGGTIYIMPYFFAKRIKNKKARIIWPEDGAIVSPVFMLVKKDKIEKHQALLDFLVSKKTGEMFVGRYFPSINPDVSHSDFPIETSWLGWDFLTNNDIGKLKDEIREVFMEVWNSKTVLS